MLRSLLSVATVLAMTSPALADGPLRVGIIGTDTSHVIAFTQALNSDKAPAPLNTLRVVAAFPGGSPDNESSASRVDGYAKQLKDEFGVEIVDSIPALLEKVDVVLLESVDGRPHLDQVRPVLEAKKPVFIDKPMTASLADAIEIDRLAKEAGVPWFSSSSLRFSPNYLKFRSGADAETGDIVGAFTYGPCSLEAHHPDLFWYGIHGVETLFTILGPGCESVSSTHTADTDVATGVWSGGRVGTFRGIRSGASDFGATVFGSKHISTTSGYSGYEPLLAEIARFFQTSQPPVPNDETLQIIAFMQAAELSKSRGGAAVTMSEVYQIARDELTRRASSADKNN